MIAAQRGWLRVLFFVAVSFSMVLRVVVMADARAHGMVASAVHMSACACLCVFRGWLVHYHHDVALTWNNGRNAWPDAWDCTGWCGGTAVGESTISRYCIFASRFGVGGREGVCGDRAVGVLSLAVLWRVLRLLRGAWLASP